MERLMSIMPGYHETAGWKIRREEAILDYYVLHCDEGYRRLAFMMLDELIVKVSPLSVYRVLFKAGVTRKWNRKPSKKGPVFPAVKGS